MSVLSDGSILALAHRRIIGIEPFNTAHVQPASYDLTIALKEPVTLTPGTFYLFDTVERITLPAHIQGSVHGRSSLGRLGVLVHFTAGYIDPGFRGTITLEVMALDGPVPIQPGDRVAQIAFTLLDVPAMRPYRGRYQGQSGATPSRFEHGDA